MKPQFTVQELGQHIKDIPATRARLLKGTSWLKQRIVVIIPTDAMIPAKVALSIWNLVFPPNQPVLKVLAQGMEVGEAYSSAIENILANPELSKWEYILTIEHDNIPPNDGLLKLLEQMENHKEYAAIGGLYFTKGIGGVAQIWGDPKDPIPNFRPQVPKDGELIECCGTGMGFTLFRTKMFKDQAIQRPIFRTMASKEGIGTQDLQFWANVRPLGYRCAIDCSVKVGHYDVDNDMVW